MTSTKATPLDRRQPTSDAAELSDTCVKSHWKHGLTLSVLALCVLTIQSASAMHPAFQNAGRTPGLEIWRIENFSAVAYPRQDFGKFYTGDSYIVLFTKQQGRGSQLSWDIHFWLGNQTSQDEAGAAAMLSVDLDDSLGGAPVQYREVQDHESNLFLSHFPSGVRYLPGGVASGFRHVDPDAVEKRLFQVKGKRNIRVRQVALDVSSMNKGDCFILDAGREVFVYSGQNSKRTERLKAIAAANQIRDQDHAGRARVLIIDEHASEVERNRFFTELGSGSPSAIAPESEGGDDLEFERQTDNNVTLYKISDASGSMVVQKVAEKPLHQNMLLTADCFILDTITSGLYVWIGRGSTKNEKLEAMRKAEQFLANNNYPQWTRIQRVVQDGETSYFKQYFSGWREAGDTMGMGRLGIAASVPDRTASPTRSPSRGKRMVKSGGCAMGFMPDDGQSGDVEIWMVKNFELEPVPENAKGFFFGGDCYVIKYKYEKEGRRGYVIYFWLGNESTNDERAAAAIHTVRLDNELSGKAVQVRVPQGNEPRHFLRIFKGKMIILTGGHASGFRNINDHDSYDVDGTRLFRVRGTCPDDTRAEQVPEVAASLNSDDAYVLETPTNTYIWQGQGCSDEEREMAVNASALVSPGRDPIVVPEGEEPEEFWEALGGQGEYSKEFSGKDTPQLEPRLFHCQIDTRGRTSIEEIGHFKQEDLYEDDVMLLDVGDEIYVWIGDKSSPEEKDGAVKLAEDYLKRDPTSRSPSTTLIISLKQGEESENFISFFPSWDPTFWESHPSYDDVKRLLEEMNASLED
ncbi:gelsolin, cytoplasmic isoform X2 [Ischnura elegans]|uniref:gelsolin, cytoplasmic isoform X2 n=1 Tax=Ischnura elegans TaxID=197161 RepID=UPI001ED89E35|nr:gelsolin, cytoplasmic isoform X2 [Ischnura elegans]